MALAIVPTSAQDSTVTAIKPYCGSKNVVGALGQNADRAVYKTPYPAWADLGTVSHMQGAVVPEDAPPNSGAPHLKAKFQAGRCLFRFSTILLSVLENVFCYLSYIQVAPPEDTFYNKFEAHMLGYPGLDIVLLVTTIVNTCYLLGFWMIISLVRMDLYTSMVTGRLPFSLTSGGICAALAFFGEGTKVFPFVSTVCTLLHLLVWTGAWSWPKKQRENREIWKNIACRIFTLIIGGWFTSFIVMFAIESDDYLYDSNCPATENTAMPIRIRGIAEWQCAKWSQSHYIRRITPPGQPVYDALCSTSFHAFNTVLNNTFGELMTSSEAHAVRCPSHCQDLGLGSKVIGCEVYSATSSICSAAVQMGIIAANAGGVVQVIGRAPPELTDGKYKRCNRHGILSTQTPEPETPDSPDWAFYFQVEGMESLDMVTLNGWRRTGIPGATEPWKSYVVDVTWVVSGASQRREVPLGPTSDDADIELNFCQGTPRCA